MYKNKVYQQHHGVSTGSALGSTLVNFFLAQVEKKMFKMNLDHYLKLCLRQVDDIFAVFEDNNSRAKFLDLLNSQHQNIKFTVERPSTTIPFVDAKITLNDTGIITKIWRKPIHTRLLLKFSPLRSTKWKFGLIIRLMRFAPPIYSFIK